jgi:hypothetical protein
LTTQRDQSSSKTSFKLSRSEWIFVALFALTLPLVNPWIRGDGVGYYAMARAPLIQHNFDFRPDWYSANTSFRLNKIDANNELYPGEYTDTGHVNNHFSIGPAILWSPFLLPVHAGVKLARHFGAKTSDDGFSAPYRIAIALASAIYGFLGIWLSYRLARKYVPEHWAFLATIAIWFSSSLPVYMYFNPSWSHAHSAFAVALFLWYWDRTRADRTWGQWILFGFLGAVMMNVYYVNAALLIVPLLESISRYLRAIDSRQWSRFARLFAQNFTFAVCVIAGFLPTLISKKIIYGGVLKFGYKEQWFWNSPAILKVGFSSEHGLFSWTPVLLLAVIGLFFLSRIDRALGSYLLIVFVLYLYVIGCYEAWAGISSFGNRFFVSLTSIFILGLSALFDALARSWSERSATVLARCTTAALILWNLGLIFQWGTHLIPARGPISWREAAYNQVAVVPEQASLTVYRYMTQRKSMMNRIEQEDVGHIKSAQPENQP